MFDVKQIGKKTKLNIITLIWYVFQEQNIIYIKFNFLDKEDKEENDTEDSKYQVN